MSCRLLTSVTPHTTRASSLGEHPPPPGLPTRSRRRHVPLYTAVTAMAPTSPRPSARADKGHVPLYTTVWASGLPWSRPSAHAPARAYRLLQPRRDSLPTRLPQRDRPGCNASPQDRELTPSGSLAGPVTVRDHARLRPASVSLSRPGHAPHRASTVHRSRQTAPEPCLTRPPADSTHGRHKARCALQSIPFVQLSWRRTLTGTGTDWTT